ncbi:hypothetical protein [Catellatospora tritici]|uniref:hypothetical protein n=1 Tax=Catellatospora tritici TaxID=2851566 RepID=UPI001C2DD40E|nr:hypothetical protein [Catellatospora tritici]MBV1852038.1 hypothetical protein [Catellatospora tritici]
MNILVGFIVGAIVSALIAEAVDLGAWAAPKIVKAAARRMHNAEARDRYCEEWNAELASLDGLKLTKLLKALDIWRGSFAVARSMRPANYVRLSSYLMALWNVMPGLVKLALSKNLQKMLDQKSMPAESILRVKFGLMLVTANPTIQPVHEVLSVEGTDIKVSIAYHAAAGRTTLALDNTVSRVGRAIIMLAAFRRGEPVKSAWNRRTEIQPFRPIMIDRPR